MKGRLSWLDVRAGVNECNRIVGAHVKTVYSITKKSILIRFSNKEQLLIDPPSKFHLTYKQHEKVNLTPIAIYLRKALGNNRVIQVRQLGFDRVAVIEMVSGPEKQFLFIEMYANGNIILTDGALKIQNLLRPVPHLEIAKESTYMVNEPQLILDLERFDSLHQKTLKEKLAQFVALSGGLVDDIQLQLAAFFEICPSPLDSQQVISLTDIETERSQDPGIFEQKFSDFCKHIMGQLISVGEYGAVTYAGNRPASFTPWKAQKLKQKNIKEYPQFGRAMDAAFTQPEVTESTAEKKNRKIREAQERSLREKQKEVETYKKLASCLEEARDEVGAALKIAAVAEQRGLPEKEFLRFKKESEAVSAAARIITGIDYSKKTVAVLINGISISVPYTCSLFEEISRIYQLAKRSQQKAEKAQAALDESRKKQQDIQSKQKPKIRQVERQSFWFEKFHWCVTKDNDLLIAGRDAKQNEILVKKYLKDTDHYFHAEIAGASSVIVGEGASEDTMETAAAMALCLSKAWAAGVVVPVYSVLGSQVKKSAPAGEYLKQGSFMVTGKKTYFHPHRLEYAFGILYCVEEEEQEENRRKVSGLTAAPAEGATVRFAMAHAGPYRSVSGPKYRMLPGTAKKGMIIKEVQALAAMDAADAHKNFVMSIPNREMELTVISNCKLAQAEIIRRGAQSVFALRGRKKKNKANPEGKSQAEH